MSSESDAALLAHFVDDMGHVYPTWPCPEGKKAREEIAEIILRSFLRDHFLKKIVVAALYEIAWQPF